MASHDLLFQAPFFYRLHEVAHMIENAVCLLYIIWIIAGMRGVIAIRFL